MSGERIRDEEAPPPFRETPPTKSRPPTTQPGGADARRVAFAEITMPSIDVVRSMLE